MENRETAEQIKKNAQGVLKTILKLRFSCDPYNEYGIQIRAFHKLSDAYKEATGKALIVNDNWQIEEV